MSAESGGLRRRIRKIADRVWPSELDPYFQAADEAARIAEEAKNRDADRQDGARDPGGDS